jgi:hypothetical protein
MKKPAVWSAFLLAAPGDLGGTCPVKEDPCSHAKPRLKPSTTRSSWKTAKRRSSFSRNTASSPIRTPKNARCARAGQRLAAEHLYITYTAGHPVESLPPLLEALVEHVEHRQQMLAQYERQPLIAPFAIDHWPDEYLECTQLFALCILLGCPDLLARVAALMDQANFVASDTLYEDLLMRVLPDRHDVDEWFHDYCTPLVQAIYADTPEEASTLLATYCEGWYAAFEHASSATGRSRRPPSRISTISTTAPSTIESIRAT